MSIPTTYIIKKLHVLATAWNLDSSHAGFWISIRVTFTFQSAIRFSRTSPGRGQFRTRDFRHIYHPIHHTLLSVNVESSELQGFPSQFMPSSHPSHVSLWAVRISVPPSRICGKCFLPRPTPRPRLSRSSHSRRSQARVLALRWVGGGKGRRVGVCLCVCVGGGAEIFARKLILIGGCVGFWRLFQVIIC